MANAFTPASYADTLPSTSVNYAPSHIGTDPFSYLPGPAADRLRMLQLRSDDLHKLVPEFSQRQEAYLARTECERRIAKLLAPAAENGFNLPDDDPRVADERKKFARLIAEAKRLDDLDAARSAQWQNAARALMNVKNWLIEGKPSGTVLEPVETETPRLQKGESLLDAVERHRRRVRELRADLARISAAPFPSTHARNRMREQVEALANRGAVSVSRLVEADGDIEWPERRFSVPLAGGVGKDGPVVGLTAWMEPDALALFAFVFKEALIAKLDAEIASEADDKNALSHEKRGEGESQILADLLATERDECALVWRAQAEHLPVEHRADISPLALLGLRLITVPHAVPSPSSPWHAYDIVGTERR